MIESTQRDIKSAIYGLTRLIAGFSEWQHVTDVPEEERAKFLLNKTLAEINELNADFVNADPKQVSALNRKLRAYQQLCLLEKFCFDEVEW